MKDLFFRFCRWALPFFGVSAVVSCDNVFNTPDMYGTQVAEYGVPVMEYVVKGKVTDANTGAPIKGIQVTSDDGCGPILTTESGDFEYNGGGMPDEKVKLTFTDIDGEENGYYDPQEVEVSVKKVEEGSGAWYYGVYVAEDVMVKLMPGDIVTPEYGVPIVEFSVKGKVMDSDFNPIENIAVRLEGSDGYVATRTSSEGAFLCEGVVMNPVIEELVFRFIDTDGSDNGGEFQEKVVSVPLSENGSLTTESIAVVMDKK